MVIDIGEINETETAGKEGLGFQRSGHIYKYGVSGEHDSDAHIEQHANDIVCNGYERTGSDSRVYFQFLQCHRNQCAEDRSKHHDSKQADGYGIADCSTGSETDKIVDIYQH